MVAFCSALTCHNGCVLGFLVNHAKQRVAGVHVRRQAMALLPKRCQQQRLAQLLRHVDVRTQLQ